MSFSSIAEFVDEYLRNNPDQETLMNLRDILKSELDRVSRKIIQDLEDNNPAETIMQLYQRWIKMKTNWKSNTITTYQSRLKKLDFTSVDALIESLTIVRAKYAPKTYNNTINALKNVRLALEFYERFQSYVKVMKILEDNTISSPHVKHTQPHTEDEMRQILNLRSDYFHMAFWLSFNCGLRAIEVEKLDVEDIDLDHAIITVRESKHDKTRYVPIPDVPKIEQHLIVRKMYVRNGEIHGEHLLWNRDGNRPALTKTGGTFSDMKKKLGFYPSMHRARAYFITKSIRNGMDTDVLAEIVGHESWNTTKMYTDTTMEEMQRQMRKQGVLTDG